MKHSGGQNVQRKVKFLLAEDVCTLIISGFFDKLINYNIVKIYAATRSLYRNDFVILISMMAMYFMRTDHLTKI